MCWERAERGHAEQRRGPGVGGENGTGGQGEVWSTADRPTLSTSSRSCRRWSGPSRSPWESSTASSG